LQLFLLAYPWDLVDEGLGSRLDRLRGEVGVTGVCVWAAIPAVSELRTRDVSPRVFRSRGGVLFQPAERFYANLRTQPIVSTWVRTSDPLKLVGDACAARDMELRAVISASGLGRLAERYPELTCRSAFGTESVCSLCLGNAQVQDLLVAMAADLSSRAGVRALVLTDFVIAWSDCQVGEWEWGSPLGRVEQFLLGMCFCAACVEHAEAGGVAATAARNSAVQLLHRSLEQGTRSDESPVDFLSQQPAVVAYRRRQVQALNAFLRKLVEQCRCPIVVDAGAAEDQGEITPEAAIPWAWMSAVERVEQLSASAKTAAARNEIRLPAWWATGARGPQLIGLLPEAARLGIAAATIDHYGVLPEPALTTLRQAIRFSRRTSSP